MVKIVPTHPYLVAEYQEMIMSSVNDQDISIRICHQQTPLLRSW